LIHHYYYCESSRDGGVDEENSSDRGNPQHKLQHKLQQQQQREIEEGGPLSLEEELAMLRKGAAAEEVLSYERGQKRAKTRDHENDNDNDSKAHDDIKNNATRKNNDCDGPNKSKTISSMKSPFSVNDTGIRGMVCLVCTLPDCELVPYDDILSEKKKIQTAMKDKEKEMEAADERDLVRTQQNGEENVREKEDDAAKHRDADDIAEKGNEESNYSALPLWDPVETVKKIMDGVIAQSQKNIATNKSNNQQLMDPPPGFRFVSRMIPMQATCFASIDEIKPVTKSLLQRYLPSIKQSLHGNGKVTPEKVITFKIDFKRRNCSHLSTMKVVEAITPMLLSDDDDKQTGGDGSNKNDKNGDTCREQVLEINEDERIDKGQTYAVNLTDPDFAIRIEVCRTFCGISVLPREEWYRNFNLAELVGGADDDDGD